MRINNFLIFGVVLLAGCGEDVSSRKVERDSAEAADSVAPIDTAVARPGKSNVQQTEGSSTPVGVIREYYNAIAAREYERAYALWENSKQTFDQLRSGFARTATVKAETGTPGRIEGAAGSRYIEIPVTVRATTTSGEVQCFRGTYTLRRSEVPGATEEQRQWRIYSAKMNARPVSECGESKGNAGAAVDSVRVVVQQFGRQLASVSLLAPADVVRRDLREKYGPLVTTALLDTWIARPAGAPGRQVSSPWPDRIDVVSTEDSGNGRYRVTADVVYVTSSGIADRKRVSLEVTRGADNQWRISKWQG